MQLSVVFALLLLTPFAAAQASQPSPAQLSANDVHVLQYALSLERLESYFYTTYQARFNVTDFINAGLTASDYSYFDLIKSHEQTHVAFLESIVPSPTSGPCNYSFPVNSVRDYIAVARILENTGVSAYDGAINKIYTPSTQSAAATIATVEARHASYLNRINNQNPFPANFDTATQPVDIAKAVFGANGFANCPFLPSFALPELLVVIPVANNSDPAQPTASTLGANDIKVLNYALFLEHLEASFYNYVIGVNFNYNGIGDNNTASYLNLIKGHEEAHVLALTSTINSLGGSAVPACNAYNWSTITSAQIAVATGAVLENTGVYAYDYAVQAIFNYGLKEVAATIATVEARHASYLNVLSNSSQGPVAGGNGAYDQALNFTQITGTVVSTGFLGNCSNALPLVPSLFFQIFTVQPYTNATVTYNTTAGTTTGATTGSVTTAGTTGTPTASPATTGTPTGTPTASPTTSGTPTASPTTSTPTSAPSDTTGTTGAASTTSRTTAAAAAATGRATTSDASLASASIIVALIVAAAAL